MAKEIKAIQCPKCGSTQKVVIRPDFFRCTSCDTEYFLDNDDIVITHNVNYNYNPATAPAAPAPKKVLNMFGVLILCIVIGFFLLTRLLSSGSRSGSGLAGIKEKDFSWWHSDFIGYAGASQQPIVVIMGQRDYTGGKREEKNGEYAGFYDPLSGKELKAQQLAGISKTSAENITMRTFTNGDIYSIFNKTLVFKINKTAMTAENVTQTAFNNHPEMASGIANAEFVSSGYGDGFNVMNNEGKSYFFYPVADKIFTKDEMYNAQKALEIRDPAAKTKVCFGFTAPGTDFPDEKRELIRYTQKDNAGGPDDYPYFEWKASYDAKGVKQKSMFRWGEQLVLSYTILTPGRNYFDPKVLYSDTQYVLLKINATAAEAAPSSLQCLNANTGAIVFTLPFTESEYFDEAVRYKDGFIVKANTSMFLVGLDGKLIKEYKTN